MYYTGCDVHADTCQLQHMDSDGALGLQMEVPTTREGLSGFLDRLDGPTVITFEASRSYWWLSQFLTTHPNVAQVIVVDPRRSRNLAQELSVQQGYGRAKNDRIDAEMMAELTRSGMAPSIKVLTDQELEMRSLNRNRLVLVCQRTRLINRLHGYFGMHGIVITAKEFINNTGSQAQVLDSAPNYLAFILRSLLDQICVLNRHIDACGEELDKLLPESHPIIKLLMTVPGIGIIIARTIHTEIRAIERFADPKNLVSYSGLAPVENESAGKKGRIKLNPHCNYFLKYAFVHAAHNARRHVRFQSKYNHDVKQHSRKRAKLNLARKIAKSVYWMMIRQEPFRG